MNTDLVSVKVDSTHEKIWQIINRPYHKLKLDSILRGILEFSKDYNGELTTETMIVKNLNDDENQLKDIARYLASVNPAKA